MGSRMTISGKDLRTMLEIVASDDSTDPDQALPSSVLTGIRALVPCDLIVFTSFDSYQQTGQFESWVGDEDDATDDTRPALEAAFWRLYWDSPCSYPDTSGDTTSVTMMSDFYHSDREYRASPLRNEYVRHLGWEREMMLCLPSRPGRVVRLLLWRRPGMDFSHRDRGLLTLLRPHLHRIFHERRNRDPAGALTVRQQQLLNLVAIGYTNSQVGRRLSISEATVRKHLENIFERLQVTSRTAAVTRAFDAGQQEIE